MNSERCTTPSHLLLFVVVAYAAASLVAAP
jgi:hypothetical protein